ncbi:hypothetical protein AA313_de0202914 [Arthrobotrys entomopaga]|nr:hypothetical protein AA313_de0202914 [Arthrobotrys entomopaga]
MLKKMTSRRHPIQALAYAPSDTPIIYAAIAETLYSISTTTHEILATWHTPPAPLQGKVAPQSQNPKIQPENEKEVAEFEESSEPTKAENEATTTESGDIEMTDSTSQTSMGKRKRSPSNTPTKSKPTPSSEPPESKKSKRSKKNKPESAVAKPLPNYIGQVVYIPTKHILAVTTLEDKSLRLLNCDILEVIKEWTLPKRPSAIIITDSDSTILVGDKFGDVYAYSTSSTTSEPQPTDGKLLLGHVSLLTTLTTATHLSSHSNTTTTQSTNGNASISEQQKKYIITADRDEHIRITNYPLTHAIHTFCLAHTQFVSRLLVTSHNTLISGGGDDWLGVWNWYAGKLLQRVDLREIITRLYPEEEKRVELVEKMKGYNTRRRRREGEEEEREVVIAVREILEVDGGVLVVVLEGVPVILRFKFTEAGMVEYTGHTWTPGPVLSMTGGDDMRVYFGCDRDEEEGGLVLYADLGVEEPSVREFFGEEEKKWEGVRVGDGERDAVNERLYAVEALRKGFGGMGEDE